MKRSTFLLSLPILVLTGLFLSPLQAKADSLKILKFEADWCGACKKMKPAFNSVSKNFSDVSFQVVNVDKQSSLAGRYKVKYLPTVIAVKDGREVGRLTGFQNAAKLDYFVKKHR